MNIHTHPRHASLLVIVTTTGSKHNNVHTYNITTQTTDRVLSLKACLHTVHKQYPTRDITLYTVLTQSAWSSMRAYYGV